LKYTHHGVQKTTAAIIRGRLNVRAYENVLYGKEKRPDGRAIYSTDAFSTGMKPRLTRTDDFKCYRQEMLSYHLRRKGLSSMLTKRIVHADRINTTAYGIDDIDDSLEAMYRTRKP